MSLYVVDIHGDIEGDYEIIGKIEEPKGMMIAEKFAALQDEYTHLMEKYQKIKHIINDVPYLDKDEYKIASIREIIDGKID